MSARLVASMPALFRLAHARPCLFVCLFVCFVCVFCVCVRLFVCLVECLFVVWCGLDRFGFVGKLVWWCSAGLFVWFAWLVVSLLLSVILCSVAS